MKSKQIFRIVATVVILTLMLIAMPVLPALAQSVSVSPATGIVGTTMTISGEGFTTPATFTITFGFGSTTPRSVGTGTVGSGGNISSTATVPEMPGGMYTIQISTSAGQALTTSFTITSNITLNKTSGFVSDQASVSGTGFAVSTSVTIYFDSANVGTGTTDANGKFTAATFIIPESYNGSHTIMVQDSAGHSASTNFSTSQSITIAPTTGASGDGVKINGTGFKARKSITITFGNLAVNSTPPTVVTDDKGSFTATFPVPLLVKGAYEATANDGTNKASVNFAVTAGASISQATGNVGTELTANGTGFTVGAKVTVTYQVNGGTKEVATTVVDSNGAFSAIFKVPVSKHGTHSIVATDGTNIKQFAFTMESTPPPIPKPLLPQEGTKPKAEVQFSWDKVEDPSGVTYTLQAATDKKFTEASIILKKEALTEPEYTLTKEERLKSTKKEAPYYWRVKAIDGASNESDWTTPGSFYVGFQWPELKGWLLYVLIIIGALLFLVLGFWLGRRTAYY